MSDRSYQDLVGTNIKHEDGFIKVNRKVQLSRLLKVNRTSQLTPGNRISLPNDLSRLERKKDEEKSVSRQEAKGETSFISAVEILTKRDTTINDEK